MDFSLDGERSEKFTFFILKFADFQPSMHFLTVDEWSWQGQQPLGGGPWLRCLDSTEFATKAFAWLRRWC